MKRAQGIEAIVQRTLACATGAFQFIIRPGHAVLQARRLGNTVAQKVAVVLKRREAADVHAPQIVRLLACENPLRQHVARAARVREAVAVETRRHKKLIHLRHFAEDEVRVGRERRRAVDHFLEAVVRERRDAALPRLDRVGDVIPIFRQRFAGKVRRDRINQARLALLRERAEDYLPAVVGAKIYRRVWIAHAGQIGARARDRFRDEMGMFDGIHRHVGTALRRQLPRPQPGTEDDLLGGNFALRGGDANRAAIFAQNTGDAHAGYDSRPALFSAFGECKRDLPGVRAAIGGQPHGATNIFGLEERPFLLCLVGGDEIDIES